MEIETAEQWFNCMKTSSRDSLQYVINRVNELFVQKFLKLTKNVKINLVRLVREMAKYEMNSHACVSILLRVMVGGDLSGLVFDLV